MNESSVRNTVETVERVLCDYEVRAYGRLCNLGKGIMTPSDITKAAPEEICKLIESLRIEWELRNSRN